MMINPNTLNKKPHSIRSQLTKLLRSWLAPSMCCLVLVIGSASQLAAEETRLVQDFEGNYQANKYPEDNPGEVVASADWKTDGSKSLKIDAGLMSAIEVLKTSNWKGYDILRLHVNNTNESATTVGFEIRDKHKGFRERHSGGFGVVAGESVVDIDISGALWRGEENKPYMGKIKTPIEFDLVKRIMFGNTGSKAIYIDQIEIVKVKKVKVDGAFAFDFGRSDTQVMAQMIGVTEKDTFNPRVGYGITGGVSMLKKNMSFPTPMLGDSIGFNGGSFKVVLPGGKYIGLIAYERGGFWEDEGTGYSKADLKANKKVVDSHTFTTDGTDFLFQDTEIVNLDDLATDLIWPAHAISEFKFAANKGENEFTLDVQNLVGYPLRIAGLIVAPDTKEGKEFLEFHVEAQKNTIARIFTQGDKGRRTGRTEPKSQLVVEELPVGEDVYPMDYPISENGSEIQSKKAIAGQTLTIHLGVYAQKDLEVEVASRSNAKVQAHISYGRYMPMRNYGVGSVWLEVNHYRPESSFRAGPDLARSVILEYVIPDDFGNGTIVDEISIKAGAKSIKLPVKIEVARVHLESIPIPVGLFMNALPIPESKMDSSVWWKLQEALLAEQMGSGLTAVSGGESLSYRIKAGNPVTIDGDNAIRYIKLAQKYGPLHAVVSYGGYITFKALRQDAAGIAAALLALEKDQGLPPLYINSFDEPRSGTDQLADVLKFLGPHKAAGLRTIGWSSWSSHEDIVTALAKNSYAVAVNIHKAEHIEKLRALGTEPWAYNNGLDRLGMGLRLWQSIKLGMHGRMQWIGLFTQGFAFHNLDGREPSSSCFMVHRDLGVLKTPRWLGVREGLVDARIRLTLEKLAKSDDAALSVWKTEAYRDEAADATWTGQKLESARNTMLQRLLELSK